MNFYIRYYQLYSDIYLILSQLCDQLKYLEIEALSF